MANEMTPERIANLGAYLAKWATKPEEMGISYVQIATHQVTDLIAALAACSQRAGEAEARAEALGGLLREAYDDVPTAQALGPDPDVDGWFCPRCDLAVEHRYLSPEAICHAPTCLISRIDAALSATPPHPEPPAAPVTTEEMTDDHD